MQRYTPALWGMSAGLFLAVAATGRMLGPAVLVVALGVAVAALFVQRRRRNAKDPGWNPIARFEFVPTAGNRPGSSRAVAAALGWCEGRQLLASAAFGAGIGLSLTVLGLFGLAFGGDFAGEIPEVAELFPVFAHPLVGMTVIAAHGARTRGRREGAEELFSSCPTSNATRTAGHLATAWLPMGFIAAFLAVLAALIAVRAPAVYGEFGARQVAHWLGAGVLGAGGIALGVALARWVPWRPAPVIAVVGVAMLSIRFATEGAGSFVPARQLSTWLTDPEISIRLTAPHWLAHHLWIVSLVVIVAVIALLRDRRSPGLALIGATAVVAAVATGVAATRAIDTDDAARIAALISNPAESQPCSDAGMPVCAYRGDEALRDLYVPEVRAVLDALPPGVLDGWALRENAVLDVRHLDPAIVERLRPVSGDAPIPYEVTAHREATKGARFWVALTAVGLFEKHETPLFRPIVDQARGVIAIWAATRGLDADTARAMASFGPSGPGGGDGPWPDSCYAGVAPVQWSGSDLEAARRLQALPDDQVAAVVAAEWDRWVEPATTTNELLAALGIDPVQASTTRTDSHEC